MEKKDRIGLLFLKKKRIIQVNGFKLRKKSPRFASCFGLSEVEEPERCENIVF